MSHEELTQVTTPDGRLLEVLVDGAFDDTLLFHSGTPSGAVAYDALAEAAKAQGIQVVTYSRPGYGDSTPHQGRSVADAVADVTTILDSLGIGSFVTFGWSGGGPHALATGALLPTRCRAVATLGGVAPYEAVGLDWMAGMGQENLQEFGAAIAGLEALTEELDADRDALVSVTGPEVADGLGDLIPPVDRLALTGEFADYLAASIRRALLNGIAGWRDDDLAFVRYWGFDLSDITVPVAIWQGRDDRMVPVSHGHWLVANVPGAEAHVLADEGHLSLTARLDEIVAGLLRH